MSEMPALSALQTSLVAQTASPGVRRALELPSAKFEIPGRNAIPSQDAVTPGSTEHAALARVAQELESVVLTQLYSAMRESVPSGGLFEESASTEIFRSMFDEELAKETAGKSPFGLARAILRQFEGPTSSPDSGNHAPRPEAFRRVG